MSTLFGTDGIRGTVGNSPFTPQDTVRLGAAIGCWITDTYGPHAQILIAQDTRQSGDWLSNALCAGLLLSPIAIHHVGILPTPGLSHLLNQNQLFHCGIALSASHNPYIDNGIKLIDRINGKLSDQDEHTINTYYDHNTFPSFGSFGSQHLFKEAASLYSAALLNQFSSLSLAGKKIVLDCAHGATYHVAPSIFSELGAEVITLHTAPNGTNINEACGALYPQSLQKTVIKHNADFGCAFDGDGDRVIMVNHSGSIKNGDDMLALLSEHPRYESQNPVVGTEMSNQGFEKYLLSKNKKLLRTAVGDRWVAAALQEHKLLLGGEQSGHIVLQDILPTGDGIATALRVIESCMHSGNASMETFVTYPQTLINIPVLHKKDLKEPSIAAIIAEYEKHLDSGRLYIRYSGTENVLRVMVEDREDTSAQRICSYLAKALEKELQ